MSTTMKTKTRKSAKNEVVEGGNDEKNEATKKPFDKKTYRLKKYSNKYKVDQWEERRRKSVLRGYYKELQKDQKHAAKTSSNLEKDAEGQGSRQAQKKGNPFFAAKQEFLKKKEEKKNKREEILRAKAEKAEALEKYKEKKALKYKKLSKKTRKGQPVMKDRLEMLLEQIQQTT